MGNYSHPLTAARACFSLKAGEWFRAGSSADLFFCPAAILAAARQKLHSLHLFNPHFPVRPEGAVYQWRKVPPSELSVELVADERSGGATRRAEAS